MTGVLSRPHRVGIRQFPRRKEWYLCGLEVRSGCWQPKDYGVHSRPQSGFSWGNRGEYLDSQDGQRVFCWVKLKASVSTNWAPLPLPVVTLTHGPVLAAD